MEASKPYNIPLRQTYMDKQSGKDFNRPAYLKLIKRLKPGVLLIVKSIAGWAEIMQKCLSSGGKRKCALK